MSFADPSPAVIVRRFLAAATVIFGVAGLIGGDLRWLAASGAFGLMWTLWDLLMANVFEPFGEWLGRILSGQSGEPLAELRPTMDDTIRLLENHLRPGASRAAVIQSAIRLEEIYATIRKDPVKARDVIERARALFPDASELKR